MRLRGWLASFKRFFIESGAPKPASKPKPKTPARRPLNGRKTRSLLMSLTPLLVIWSGCTTKPPTVTTDRPCYQWLISKDQEVYVYENGHLIARIETEPYDAVISGWCVMAHNEHLMNDILRLSQ
jgi:hypothetical protein